MAEHALVTEGLTKAFGGFTAVRDVDFSVRRHAIHALIGPNGSCKTTLFNLLSKVHTPTGGRILYEGTDVTHESSAAIARRGIVRSFQISATFPHMSVRDNVRVALQRRLGTQYWFWRSIRSLSVLDDEAMVLLSEVGLADYADTNAADLSYGRKRTLEIATTLALDPPLLLLDEPTQGMALDDVDRIKRLIRRIAVGRTILMVEHNMSVVADLCDAITVLQRGEILAQGSYAEVSNDPGVKAAYLGGGHA